MRRTGCPRCGLVVAATRRTAEDCLAHLAPRYALAQRSAEVKSYFCTLEALHRRYRSLEERLDRAKAQERLARKEAGNGGYMTQVELESVRAGLEAMRNALAAAPKERPTVSRLPDPIDDAIEQMNNTRIADDRTREVTRMREIDAAIDAIRGGTYGVCVDCEAPIPAKRLAAVPWATRCRACAEREEQAR